LGTVYAEMNETEKAEQQFDLVPPDSDHYIESRIHLAYLYDKDEHYDQALSALQQALDKRPKDTELMNFIAGVYREKKDLPAAINVAKKMVALEPKNDKFHFTLGALYDEAKEKQLSIDEMREAIKLNPSNAQALNYLGYTYAEMGTNLTEAERLIRRALQIEPEDGFYIDSLGWVYYQQGHYDMAVKELEKAWDLAGDDPTITEHLADAYEKLGKLKQAHSLYKDALSKAKETDQVTRLKDKLQALRDDGHSQP